MLHLVFAYAYVYCPHLSFMLVFVVHCWFPRFAVAPNDNNNSIYYMNNFMAVSVSMAEILVRVAFHTEQCRKFFGIHYIRFHLLIICFLLRFSLNKLMQTFITEWALFFHIPARKMSILSLVVSCFTIFFVALLLLLLLFIIYICVVIIVPIFAFRSSANLAFAIIVRSHSNSAVLFVWSMKSAFQLY